MLQSLELPKSSNKSTLRARGTSYKCKTVYRDNQGQNILDKLSFLCELAHHGKSPMSIFQKIFASMGKVFVLGGGLNIGL